MSGPFSYYTWKNGITNNDKRFAVGVAYGSHKDGITYSSPQLVALLFASYGFTPDDTERAAKDYRDYLNMRHEAMEEAVKDITITTAVAKRLAGSTP